jgi:hypothetical protein
MDSALMHLGKERLESRVAAERLQQRAIFHPQRARITLPVGALEPLECPICVAKRGINQRHPIGRRVDDRRIGKRLGQEFIRLWLAAELIDRGYIMFNSWRRAYPLVMARHVLRRLRRSFRFPFSCSRWSRCTRLRYQHRQMAQPLESPFHGRLCLCEFARALVAECLFSPEVRALMGDDVSVEIVAAFFVGHAL